MRLRPLSVLAWLLLGMGLPLAGRATDDAVAESASARLARALDRRFGCDLLGRVAIRIESRSGEVLARDLELASKTIDGRLHSRARFTGPPYLRGSAFLTIERPTREASDDHFLHLRTLGRVRRISSAQRGDAFLGSDLSYEDFERRRGDDYEARFTTGSDDFGEPVHWIEARPRFDSGYERIAFAVAANDDAIVATRYFRGPGDEPYKELRAERGSIHSAGDCRVPTQLVIENRRRGSKTYVAIEQLELGVALDDDLFSAAALESGRAPRAQREGDAGDDP
jgi:hypothetical protein